MFEERRVEEAVWLIVRGMDGPVRVQCSERARFPVGMLRVNDLGSQSRCICERRRDLESDRRLESDLPHCWKGSPDDAERDNGCAPWSSPAFIWRVTMSSSKRLCSDCIAVTITNTIGKEVTRDFLQHVTARPKDRGSFRTVVNAARRPNVSRTK